MILSVVIPTHNKCHLLGQTLTALCAQDLGDLDWEVVVVDDGSTDGTAMFLADLAGRTPRLRVVSPAENVGRARARNLGWRGARGRWILFLDDDILVPDGLLEAHLGVLEQDPSYATIGHAVTAPDIVDAPHFYYLDTRAVAKLPAGPAPGKYFVTQNSAVPRLALERIGGFDESYSAYGFEDMDIGFRLEDAGVRFRALPQPLPQHIHHHTLEEYLEKKRICGRGSLQQIAATHPQRLQDMRLDLVVDPPGEVAGAGKRLLRWVLRSFVGPLTSSLLAVWPTHGSYPVMSAVYLRCMDGCVLSCYCQGLADSDT